MNDNSIFKLENDGVYLVTIEEQNNNEVQNEPERIKICDYLNIIASIKTLEDKNWKIRLEFNDMDGERCNIDVERSKFLQSNLREMSELLLNKGLCIYDVSKTQEYLKQLITKKNKQLTRYIETTRTGWIDIDKGIYICPSFSISRHCDETIKKFIFAGGDSSGYSKRGTFEEWHKNVAELSIGNCILTFALCLSLAPILMPFIPEIKTTIFHGVGKTSIGKTTMLRLAASVWGDHRKYIKQWRSTGNAQEGIAEQYNHSLMILDEIGQADDKSMKQSIYMFGNEKGKSRMDKNSQLKETKTWNLLCLSSGEVGISEKIEAAGAEVNGGILVRCVDTEVQVSEENGIFEYLHNCMDGDEFSKLITTRCSQYYGTAAEKFLKGLFELNIDIESEIRSRYEESLERIKEGLCLKNVKDGRTNRILNVLAFVNAAGLLACSDYLNVLPHGYREIDDSISKIAKKCLSKIKSREDDNEEIFETVLDILETKSSHIIEAQCSKIGADNSIKGIHCRDGNNIKSDIYGYKIETDEGRIYFMIPNTFKKEICKNIPGRFKRVKEALIAKGALKEYLESDGGREKKRYKKFSIAVDGQRVTHCRLMEIHINSQ